MPAACVRAPLPPDDQKGDGERRQTVRDVCRSPGDWVRAISLKYEKYEIRNGVVSKHPQDLLYIFPAISKLTCFYGEV